MATNKPEVKQEVAEAVEVATSKLTNNTKGLRSINGIRVLPGKSVDVTREQVVAINKNPCAMAWIASGDFSLV